jgi:hypothetical protein
MRLHLSFAVTVVLAAGCGKDTPEAQPPAARAPAAGQALEPVLVKRDPGTAFQSVRARGDLAYLVVSREGAEETELRVYDMTKPTTPSKVATLGGLRGDGLALAEDRAYLYSYDDGYQSLVDLASAREPKLVHAGNEKTGVYKAISLVPSGKRAFVVAGGHILAVDATSPDAPAESWKIELKDTDTDGAALTRDGSTLCLAAKGGGDNRVLVTLAVKEGKPSGSGKLTVATTDDESRCMATLGRCAYFFHGGLKAVDVSDPAAPKHIATMTKEEVFGPEGFGFFHLASDGRRLFVSGDTGLVILEPDATGKLEVRRRVEDLAELAGDHVSRDLAVGAKAAYLLSGQGDLVIVPLASDG